MSTSSSVVFLKYVTNLIRSLTYAIPLKTARIIVSRNDSKIVYMPRTVQISRMVKRMILAWGEKLAFLLSVYSGSTKIILTALIASFGSIYS